MIRIHRLFAILLFGLCIILAMGAGAYWEVRFHRKESDTGQNGLVEKLHEMETRLERLEADNVRLQQDRDTQFIEVLWLTDMLNQNEEYTDRLRYRNLLLLNQVNQLERVLKNTVCDFGPPPESPDIDGEVTAVESKNMVEISPGSADGIREGQVFDVIRGNTYLGRITIVRVTSDRAAAEVDPRYQQGPMQKGDRVKSVINE